MREQFYEKNDRWEDYITSARMLDDDPHAFVNTPAKMKLLGMMASYESVLPLPDLNGKFPTVFQIPEPEDPKHSTFHYVSYKDLDNGREWFRDYGTTVKWRGLGRNDREPLQQMLELARKKWPDQALKINGTRQFKRAAYDVAYANGFEVEGAEFELYKKHRDMDRAIATKMAMERKYGIKMPDKSLAMGF